MAKESLCSSPKSSFEAIMRLKYCSQEFTHFIKACRHGGKAKQQQSGQEGLLLEQGFWHVGKKDFQSGSAQWYFYEHQPLRILHTEQLPANLQLFHKDNWGCTILGRNMHIWGAENGWEGKENGQSWRTIFLLWLLENCTHFAWVFLLWMKKKGI